MGGPPWKNYEERTLIDNYHCSKQILLELLPHRSWSAIKLRANRLGLKRGNKEEVILERFWYKVNKYSGVFGENNTYKTECWIWLGSTSRGYGQFWDGGRKVCAHRWAYENFVGKIPSELECDHLCRNRKCVNPNHIEPVSNRENNLRSNSITALNARKTHCKRGHEFSKENTYLIKSGGRMCRACKLLNERTYQKRKRFSK